MYFKFDELVKIQILFHLIPKTFKAIKTFVNKVEDASNNPGSNLNAKGMMSVNQDNYVYNK